MLLHECSITETRISSSTEYDDYKVKIKEEHLKIAKNFITKQNKKLQDIYGYREIRFHLIIFPVPDKLVIVERFTN